MGNTIDRGNYGRDPRRDRENDYFDEEDAYWDTPDENYYDEAYEEDDFEDGRNARLKISRNKKRKRGGARIVFYLVPVILVLVFVFSGYMFLTTLLEYRAASSEYTSIRETIEILQEDEEEKSEEETIQEEESLSYPLLSIDFDGLKALNEEFVGVLYIPVLDLLYPIAQGEDNTKYLTTTFGGSTNSSGSIFLDCAASCDFSDSNTFIFGHNMKNGTMFGSLNTFLSDETLCESDPYIYIYREDGVRIYRIFAYYTLPVDDAAYNDFYGDDAYDAYVERALSRSNYTFSGGLDYFANRPNLLTLSTCYATGHTHNFVVQAALVGIASMGAFE